MYYENIINVLTYFLTHFPVSPRKLPTFDVKKSALYFGQKMFEGAYKMYFDKIYLLE